MARRARSPSSSSTTTSTSATSSGCAAPASTSRSCPASCRSTISRRSPISRRAAARWCRPGWRERFDGLDKDPQTHALVAAAVAAEQVLDLVERGVGDFHFYTMNRADLAFAICHMIGIRGAKMRRRRRASACGAACRTPSASSALDVASALREDDGASAPGIVSVKDRERRGEHVGRRLCSKAPQTERPGVGPAFPNV